ncbi:MAG TPA: hypothetical protein VGB55_04080 [Tepidisphaeraceae bacterium]|jgi:hypothetical protein
MNSSIEPTSSSQLPAVVTGTTLPARVPTQQMGDLPTEELAAMAEEFGLRPKDYPQKPDLIAAIHARRQLIASLDKHAMLDVLNWCGRSIAPGISNEQMAIEIVHLRVMRFVGLSQRGLIVLCLLRGVPLIGNEDSDALIRGLKNQEGFFTKIRRKSRSWVAKRLERVVGDSTTELPPPSPEPNNKRTDGPRPQALREEIEESGFFGGIANRVKKQADSYVNQKLDEIEARIDRKLDEIDRRLAEWRDKEIANRIRILKITLWASVVVAVISLVYSYVQVEMRRWNHPTDRSAPPTSLVVPGSITSSTAAPTEIPTSRPSGN